MLMRCSQWLVLLLQHLWTPMAVVSAHSFISASCCYCKMRHWKKDFGAYVVMFLCMFMYACLQPFAEKLENKLSCRLLISIDKRRHNKPHNVSHLGCHSKQAVMSVNQRNFQVSSWQARAFVLKSLTIKWHRNDRHAHTPNSQPRIC